MKNNTVYTLKNAPFHIKENSLLARIAAGKLGTGNVAMVLGSTIHLYGVTKDAFLKNEQWLKHELCHVQQFKQYGYTGFIIKYLWESIKHGYHNNKYEIEARTAETL